MGLFNKKGKQAEQERTNKDLIMEICETIDGAASQLDLIKKEYAEVNRYLEDAHIISSLPQEVQEDLTEQASHLIHLKRDMAHIINKKPDMTEFQYGIMERYEKEMEAEINRMKKEEEYKKTIESDLRKLAGEKGVLVHEEEEEKAKKRFLTRLGVFSGFLILLLLVMYLTFYAVFELFLDLPFLITIGGGILLTLYLLVESERNKKAIRLNAAKINKLTALTNKVKIKYVNQTSSLDYTRDKYAVNSATELEERYAKYLSFKEEELVRRKALSNYDRVKEKVRDILLDFAVHDTEVWTIQPEAIIDKKEMVEIRHRLNERRGKLRERFSFNEKIIRDNLERLRQMAERYPEERRMIYEMAEIYQVKL